ncbi:ATP-binding protein [Mucilaginibacter lacusdianchii]|uniref:ATP-binding protein n=1 Tax=Mucilaginibacter lacusdianchii TaxID=2684211 RepID=UPI00131CB3C5|nr:ATP-binding protein [Mucilaginibacter sp. JXJ CY 39]
MNFFRPLFWLITILLLNSSPAYCAASGSSHANKTPQSILDLRKQSFATKINLNGRWLFTWGQLVNSESSDKQTGQLIQFPQLWNGHLLNNKPLPAFGYASYSTTVLLPKTAGPLQVIVPDVYCAYRLYANGKIVAENGKVSTSAKGFKPHWESKTFDVPLHTDTLKLILQVANFVHSKGGINQPIVIGKKEVIELQQKRAYAADLLLAGCLMMGGLFFFGLYLFGNRDKAILFFALFTLAYSYRIIGSGNYELHTILPNFDWDLAARLEYISLYASIGLFGFYCRYLYPQDQNTRIVFTVGGISLLFSVATLLLPPLYFTQLMDPFLLVAVFCIAYVPFLYIKAYRNKRQGSVYSLASALVLMVLFTISLLHYWAIISSFTLFSFAGYIAFFFLQSMILSGRVAYLLKKAGEQAAEGLKAKSEFLSTMSHEIRTPLNSVVGMSHLLLKNNPRDDQREQLNAMIFSANNLLNIVNDILDYSKIEAGMIKLENIEMDVMGIAQSVVTSLLSSAQDKGLQLNFATDTALQNKILGDPTRTSQVITNLVHNAIKFTSVGEVKVTIRVQEQNANFVTLLFEVSDTGIGISAQKQALIFDRFTQADSSISRGFGGTGLGLAICKKILELQHSTLRVKSEEGRGSTFCFVQTFEKGGNLSKLPSIEPNKLKDEKPFTGLRVLVVDDNPMNIMVAQSFLKRWGALVDVATDGQQALNKIDTAIHKLVLMDIHMPVMDGYESARTMRTKGINTPIIALTAALPSEIETQVELAGMDDIIVKPFLPDELYSKVYQYIFNSPPEVII